MLDEHHMRLRYAMLGGTTNGDRYALGFCLSHNRPIEGAEGQRLSRRNAIWVAASTDKACTQLRTNPQ